MNQPVGKKRTSLSVVIVNWNSKDYLRQCLKSIELAGEGLATQVIVVDGGSFDGCDEMLSNEFPWVEFIQSKDNIGFGRCNNLGADKASGEYLLLLNPDTELKPGALCALIKALQTLPRAGAIGARLLNTDGTLQTSSVQTLPTPINQALDSNFLRRLFPKSKLWGTYHAFQSVHPIEVEAVSGACIAMPAQLFRKIGGFSPEYFMYAEDMDLCFKVRQSGYHIYHQPNSGIIHHGGGSSTIQVSTFAATQKHIALSKYFYKNYGLFHLVSFKTCTFLSSCLRIAALTLYHKLPLNKTEPHSKIKKWKAIAKASLQNPD